MLKRSLSVLLAFIFTISATVTAYAADYPSNAIMQGYQNAVNANDHEKIILYGSQIIDFYKNRSDDDKLKLNVTTPKYRAMALSYEVFCRWDECMNMWSKYEYYAKKKGWDDAVREAVSRQTIVNGYRLQVFTNAPISSIPFNNGKYEPKAGIYFGKPCNTYEKFMPDKPSSMISTYGTYGAGDLVIPDDVEDKILLVNWNIPENNYGILSQIPSQADYIRTMAIRFRDYGKPVLLRFAGEMNVWEPRPDPTIYKNAFIAVANVMRANASNVAMVWAPTDVSAFGVNINDFYPGDSYVDWVGISSYTDYNFLGKNDNNDFTNATFFSSKYANPFTHMEEVVKAYGGRKPIVLTESGVSHYSTVTGEDFTNWASKTLSMLYYYMPMIYPQIKGIVHFDVRLQGRRLYYDLAGVPALQKVYNEAIKWPSYLPSMSATCNTAYEKLTNRTSNGIINLYAYAAFNTSNPLKVAFYLNGALLHETTQIPYKFSLNMQKRSPGEYTLEIKAFDGGKLLETKAFKLIRPQDPVLK